MTRDVKAATQQFIEALHALEQDGGDGASAVEALVALYADGAKLTNSAMLLEGEIPTGPDAIRTFWKEYKETLGRVLSEFQETTYSEESAGLFWTTKGTDSEFAYDGATLLHFDENGKIDRFHGYYDTQLFNKQMNR